MPKLPFRPRMATYYTGIMTVVGLLALLLKAPTPALGIIAGLWLWFAKAFWVYRRDMGVGGIARSGNRLGAPEEIYVRLRRVWR
jgi:hypothetical protein